jgi:multidrug resistance protein
MAIGPLAIDMYLPALPTLATDFKVDAARVQHTLSAYLLGLAVGQLAFGPIADRYGRKPPLLGGLAVFTLASIGCLAAGTIGHFVILRFAQALGGASGMVVIRAVIRDKFDEIQSARVLSLMMLVMGAAPILAPLAGGWLLVNGSWHWIFAFLAAYTVMCICLVAIFLEEKLHHGVAGEPPHGGAPRRAARARLGRIWPRRWRERASRVCGERALRLRRRFHSDFRNRRQHRLHRLERHLGGDGALRRARRGRVVAARRHAIGVRRGSERRRGLDRQPRTRADGGRHVRVRRHRVPGVRFARPQAKE